MLAEMITNFIQMNCCFYTIFSRIILKHISPKISSSHEANCYTNNFSILLRKETEQYLFNEAMKNNVRCYQRNGNIFDRDKVIFIDYKDLVRYKVEIKHYYKFYTFKYNSLFSYICAGFTRIDVVICNISTLKERLIQYLFDRKSKESALPLRINLLRLLIELREKGLSDESPKYLFQQGDSYNIDGILTKLYGSKWVLSKHQYKLKEKLQLAIDSFVETGELSLTQESQYLHNRLKFYLVTGKAFATLSQYEEDERRHKENYKSQKSISYLTVALVLVGILQAITNIDITKKIINDQLTVSIIFWKRLIYSIMQ
ncbi:hypothetical protein VU08_06555 [Desulfobulbus sp. F5]|nr:hypothetical protein [Desulfobulbus sp. F5]